jgi:NADPH:quinone reductase-like Zn-dependent oxidoreductase
MKAIVYHTYGSPDVLKLEEVEKPSSLDGLKRSGILKKDMSKEK